MPFFAHLSALSDPLRARALLVLERHELTVSEVAAVLQMPMSKTSRLLKSLAEEDWLVSWTEGTTRRYRMASEAPAAEAGRLWKLVREQAAALPAAAQDEQRARQVLAERRSRSQEFFSTAAGEWDRMREELFGSRTDLQALLALLDPGWVVGDLGCGTGRVSAALAPFVGQVIAVDDSPEMLQSARGRLEHCGNVDLRQGDLAALPIQDASLDAAILALVLHYLPEPAAALSEVARALRPGGTLLVVDMTPHDREDLRQQMGHVALGFSQEKMAQLLGTAGFERVGYSVLAPDPQATGPTLFAARGTRG